MRRWLTMRFEVTRAKLAYRDGRSYWRPTPKDGKVPLTTEMFRLSGCD